MKCVNDEIRRQDRVLNEEEALDLLAQTEYGILSMKMVCLMVFLLTMFGTNKTLFIFIVHPKERNFVQ